MKIVHITTGLCDGGAEATLFRLVEHHLDQPTTVISMLDLGKYGAKLQALGITVHCLNMPRGRLTLTGVKTLWRILRQEQPDVVQTWMYHANLIGGLIARLAGCPRVIWGIRQGTFSNTQIKFSTLVIIRLSAIFSYIVPHAIVCCAQTGINEHIRIGYNRNRFALIANGFDPERFKTNQTAIQNLLRDWQISTSVPLLGMVARFDPQKDHYNLLSALAIMKQQGVPFRCVLIGKGMDSSNQKLQRWLNELDLNTQVELLGPREDIANIMAILDLHILSSAYGEAFPNVLAEAMAVGTPCISTDVGDAARIIGDTGWLVPHANSVSLANAIVHALNLKTQNPTAWQLRQQHAQQRIQEQFSITKMINAYQQVWQGQ